MRVLCIVSIKIGNSLLLVLSWEPVFNEILNLSDIHKLYIVNMSILLSFYDDVRGDTFVTHGFRIGLMILTGPIDLIAHF